MERRHGTGRDVIYSLDTNVIIRGLRGQGDALKTRMITLGPERVVVPEMVRAELLTGARKSGHPQENINLVEAFLEPLKLLPFAGEAVEHYTDIRELLERQGMRIGPNDLIIAATTRAHAATLITSNLKEFKRVPGLLCEDW